MASINSSIFNLSEDNKKLGFRLPQSNPQFNWRNNPSVPHCRDRVKRTIEFYLAQNASGEFKQQIAMLAAYLESQLFRDAISENEYMDREKFFSRIENLISQKWSEVSFARQEAENITKFTTNSDRPIENHIIRANVGCDLICAPNCSVDVPKRDIYSGSLNCITNTPLSRPESVLPIDRSFNMGSFNAESVDNGTAYFKSDLQNGSEARLQSHVHEPRNFTKGEINKIISSEQASSSLLMPAMVGKNLKFLPFDADDVHVHQSVLESLQFTKQASCLQSHCDKRFGEISPLESLFVQNLCSCASGTISTSTLSPDPKAVKLLCGFIRYNSRAHEVPFLEFLHSHMCKDSICDCDKYKFWLSHHDNCDSADCELCVSARKMGSNKLLMQPGLDKHTNGFEGLTCGSVCGKRVDSNTSDDVNPAKSRKLSTSPGHDSSSDVSAVTEEPISPSEPLMFEKPSVSPVMATVTNTWVNKEIITSPSVDILRSGESDSDALDDSMQFKSGDATIFSENPSSDFQLKDRILNHADDAAITNTGGNGTLDDIQGSNSDGLSADMVPDSGCELPSNPTPNLCEDKCFVGGSNPQEGQLSTHSEGLLSSVSSWTKMKSEMLTVEGLSLIDFFTAKEVRQHISSLSQKDDQDTAEEIMATRASCSFSENSCQLCGMDKLAFAPMPIYCSSCGARIKNHATYYCTDNKSCAQFCFCITCYNKCHRNTFTFQGVSFSKSSLASKRNDMVTVEPWVQCDRCEGWQHQICGLFNDKKDLGGRAEYICPLCHVKDLECGRRMPLPRSTSLDASSLSQTLLSDHLEQRLFRSLKQERENRAKAAGMHLEEVLQPADLFVRVVSSVDKILKVKQQFLDIFPEKNYPAEFPYRSKVILLFQRIDGADVCLFAMYVQEFGSECSQPNQRCIYISYLDSVKYFRPEIKTVKGEALRTFVYHEILVGYLEYCKKRGFATCYIWACPPVKGEDYILYCHPETQKTPKPDKLRQWYQSMLKKAIEEKVVVNFSNLYEKFFVPTGESNTKVTAARLPYFDGDYWSSVADNMIKKIELESGGDPRQQVKKITRRSLKAMGHYNPSADDAKDILLMQALAQNISSAKEDFIIVYLHFICSHCDEVILTGERWFCNQCKNYQLCGRCHDLCQQSGPGNTHISSAGQTHALSQETVNDVPVDTEDNDVILDKCFLENRHTFLSFCQGNHYQFDLLRRGKHSSMMILHHLHNLNVSKAGTFCSLCFKDTCADPRWICEICPEFSVCRSCYERCDGSCHIHTLIHLPTATGTTASKVELIKQLLDVLLHASRCRISIGQRCSYPNCMDLKKLFTHTHSCNVRVPGGCPHCKKTWCILLLHARRCKDPNCNIPRCKDLKNHVKSLEFQSTAKQKKILRSDCSQSV